MNGDKFRLQRYQMDAYCIWSSENQFLFRDLNPISIATNWIKKSNAKFNSFLFLFSDHHHRHHHHHHLHHRHHHRTYYRFTSNSASSVLRILEERVFAVGSNHQQDHHHHHQQQRSHWNCCFTLFELLENVFVRQINLSPNVSLIKSL